jgi:uncharacterized membrane protein HdeD (DUF308 family)
MLAELSKVWWAFLIRGLAAILFGVLALFWPAATLAVLVILFGAYVLVDGVFLLVKAIGSWKARDDRWLLLIGGLLSIGIGVMTFVAPAVTAVALLFYIAAWSLATGIIEIVSGIRLRKELLGEIWWILAGIASIIFAVLLMLFPGAGVLGVLWLISAYAIVFGVLLVILSFRLLSHRGHAKAVKT